VAASAAGDRQFEARSKYNAGNSLFRQSETQQANAPRGAVDLLNRSVEAYRRALQLDPALVDAAHNLEVARLQMKRLLEQPSQNAQGGQNQPNSEDQDLSGQLQKLLEQQQQASQEGEKLSEQQQQQGNPQDLQAKSQELSQKQQEIQQQTEELAKQMQQSANQQQQQVEQNLKQAAGHQQQAQEKLNQQQLRGAGEDQKKAEDALRQALQQANGQPGDQAPEQQQTQAENQQPESSPSSAEGEQQPTGRGAEAPLEDARDILDQERANRRQRQIRQIGGVTKVERDW
jgi:hypothetical protein